MQERSSTKRPRDLNELLRAIVDEAAGNAPEEQQSPETPQKNAHAQALGKLGGRKGGPAGAAKLTSQRRRGIARKAAKARWSEG